ncbi:MAG: phenylacetate-CoA ligase [Parcubacteria group bacterium Gr01-1014_49]|nr:MAG: phenylacetate-CoA ligase [Parcubacteria group bacterium Gr01-1014_49]
MFYAPDMERLRAFLSRTVESPISSFYRDRFLASGISAESVTDQHSFQKLPFLTRAELESVSPLQRTYVPQEEVLFASYTSGTTSGKPLITLFSDIERYDVNISHGYPVSRALVVNPVFLKNLSYVFLRMARESDPPLSVTYGDSQNLVNSAILARETACDMLVATPTLALHLAGPMAAHYDVSKIKLISLASESLTRAKRAQLSALYPAARIANVYGMSEVAQLILVPCKKIIEEGRDAFHVVPTLAAVELVDGELVITYDRNRAGPLIRYCTGDHFVVESEHCDCGLPGPVLGWEGRTGVDTVKVNGIEIKLSDVEALFAPLTPLMSDHYQVHFYTTDDASSKLRVVVEISDPVIFRNSMLQERIRAEVLPHLLAKWKMGSASTFADAISRGFAIPPEIVFVERFSHESPRKFNANSNAW